MFVSVRMYLIKQRTERQKECMKNGAKRRSGYDKVL